MARKKIPIGSHIKVNRGTYAHHGIYVGRGKVIHHSGWSTGIFKKGPIAMVSLEEFLDGGDLGVVEYGRKLSKEKILANARSKLDEENYSIFSNNCEHFATWCSTGTRKSAQVRVFLVGGTAALAIHNYFEW